MRRSRWLPVLAATLVVAVAGAACSSSSSPSATRGAIVRETPQLGGTLRFGLTHDPNGLDPTRNAWEAAGMQVAVALFDTITAQGADGRVHPYLAESIKHNDDYTVWTTRLRPGISFHDGAPVDADAFVTFTEAIRKSLVTGQAAVNVASVEKVDALTVALTMHRPWASFPSVLTGQAGAVVSPRQLGDPDSTTRPAGTGPFKLQSWNIGKQLRLVRNPDYWRKDDEGRQLPYLDGVDFLINEDPLSRVHELQDGRIDLTHDRNVTVIKEYDRLAAEGAIDVERDKGPTETTVVAFNAVTPPFDDVRVRQAMSLALDGTELADKAGWARDRIASGPIPPSSSWHSGVKRESTNQAKARALIEEYTRTTGTPLTFTLGVATEDLAAASLVEQWARVGATATLEDVDAKAETILLVAGRYQAIMQTYYAADDPDILWHFWHSSTIAPINSISLNFARLADPEIDQALDTGRASGDRGVRMQAYAKLQERLAVMLPQLSLYHTDWVIAAAKNVRQAKNMTLPDGSPAAPYTAGVFRLTETFLTPPA